MSARPAGELPKTIENIEEGIQAGWHFGAQLYISRHHKILFDGALGTDGQGKPLRRDTLLPWLSSSKPLTAVALARLWEQGRLDLDDPVAGVIPEFAQNGKDRITFRHLLTHTGGIRLLNAGWPKAGWDEIIAGICAMKPEARWIPGEKAGYHRESSWFMLGEAIQRISGRNFSSLIRDEVLVPAGMEDSWLGMEEEDYEKYKARLGSFFNTEKNPVEAWSWTGRSMLLHPSPGRSAIGPIGDLGRFYEMFLRRGSGSNGVQVLSAQAVEAMTARHRTGMYDHTFRHVLDWGLGFIINSNQYGADTVPYGYGRHASPRTFGHSGLQSSAGFADPEQGLVVALIFNGSPGAEVHEKRVRATLGSIYEDLGLTTSGDPEQVTEPSEKGSST